MAKTNLKFSNSCNQIKLIFQLHKNYKNSKLKRKMKFVFIAAMGSSIMAMVNANIQPNLCLYDQEAVKKEIDDFKNEAIDAIEQYKRETLAEIEKAKNDAIDSIQGLTEEQKCLRKGDSWQRAGLLGTFRCIHTFNDGGKPCAASSQCEGDCIVTSSNGSNPACKRDDSPFGCYATVENFKDTPFILCRD